VELGCEHAFIAEAPERKVKAAEASEEINEAQSLDARTRRRLTGAPRRHGRGIMEVRRGLPGKGHRLVPGLRRCQAHSRAPREALE
jgi:hypothetical protein